jgi:hypothetical protein
MVRSALAIASVYRRAVSTASALETGLPLDFLRGAAAAKAAVMKVRVESKMARMSVVANRLMQVMIVTG